MQKVEELLTQITESIWELEERGFVPTSIQVTWDEYQLLKRESNLRYPCYEYSGEGLKLFGLDLEVVDELERFDN